MPAQRPAPLSNFSRLLTAVVLSALIAGCGGGASASLGSQGDNQAGKPQDQTPAPGTQLGTVEQRLLNCPVQGTQNGQPSYRCLAGEYIGQTSNGTPCQTIIKENGQIIFRSNAIDYPAFRIERRLSWQKSQDNNIHRLRVYGESGPLAGTEQSGNPPSAQLFLFDYNTQSRLLEISVRNSDAIAGQLAASSCRTQFR